MPQEIFQIFQNNIMSKNLFLRHRVPFTVTKKFFRLKKTLEKNQKIIMLKQNLSAKRI